MIRYGFIHTKEDIKFLVLFAMDLLPFPVTFETVVDLITWCDDGFGYFELSEAFYEMIPTGHIDESIENGAKLYAITDKGREHEEITCDAIAYPVMQRALTAVQRFNNQMQRKGLIETNVRKEESGDFIAELCLRDDAGILMRLELSAPTLSQARGLTRAYEKQADSIYQQMMTLLLGGSGEKHADV